MPVSDGLVREYAVMDKSGWSDGPWKGEPDKVHFIDAATDLDCLLVRNHSGAWCGYVGVTEGHPFFGVDYSGCAQQPHCGESWCGHSPGSSVSVHGGLTFADTCSDGSREMWERWRTSMHAKRDEARRYPKGDAARSWREDGHLLNDYEAWAKAHEARAICHVPVPGRPHNVWWLGFDCSHSGDASPAYDSVRDQRALFSAFHRDDVYRDRAYVEGETRSLARQLRDLAVRTPLVESR